MYLRHEGYLYTNIYHSLQLGTLLSDLQQSEVKHLSRFETAAYKYLNMEHFNCCFNNHDTQFPTMSATCSMDYLADTLSLVYYVLLMCLVVTADAKDPAIDPQ